MMISKTQPKIEPKQEAEKVNAQLTPTGSQITTPRGGVRVHYLTEVGTSNSFGNSFTFGKLKRAVEKMRMADKVRAGDYSEFESLGKAAKKNAWDALYGIANECLNRVTSGIGYHPVELVGFGGSPQYGGESNVAEKYPLYVALRAEMNEADADPAKRRAFVMERIPDGVAGFWVEAAGEASGGCIKAVAEGKKEVGSDYNPYRATNNPMGRLARLGAI